MTARTYKSSLLLLKKTVLHLKENIVIFLILPTKLKTKLHGLSPRANYIPTERPPLVGEVIANLCG
jgi:hypothetical protein